MVAGAISPGEAPAAE